MAEYLPIRAFHRSPKVRIANKRAHTRFTTYVDLENTAQRVEFARFSAIGAVYVVGPIRNSLPTGATLTGLAPTAATPGTAKKVNYSEGNILTAEGAAITVAAGTTAAFGAAAANPRIDVVEVKNDGSEVKIKAGTEAASPVAPAVDSGYTAIAQVALAKEFTEVLPANVTDVRVLN